MACRDIGRRSAFLGSRCDSRGHSGGRLACVWERGGLRVMRRGVTNVWGT